MQKMMKRAVYVLAMMFLLSSGAAMAQTGFGVRAGVTLDPEQFHFGAHFISDPLVGQLTFRPNLELGVGSNRTTVATNLEFAYRIPLRRSDLSFYIGAGPALNFYRFDNDRGSDTGGGFNVLLGLEHEEGLFGEVKVGAIDSPEFKLTIGYTFR